MRKLTAIEHLTAAVQAAKQFANGLAGAVAQAAAEDAAALESSKLDKAGGTLTGDLTGKQITGTRLRAANAAALEQTAEKVAVLDQTGWLCWRAPADLLGDMGGGEKPVCSAVDIPAAGWGSDTTEGYPKYWDIALAGVAASDRADVLIAPQSAQTAKAAGLCPACETMPGKVRLRAAAVPSAALHAAVWVTKGEG